MFINVDVKYDGVDYQKHLRRNTRRGWFGDSHRHYLAAKGIKSTISPARKAYFVRDIDKGPQGQPKSIARARAKGFTNQELLKNDDVRREFEQKSGEPEGTILNFIEQRSKDRKRGVALPESTSTSQQVQFDDLSTLPEEDIVVEPSTTLPLQEESTTAEQSTTLVEDDGEFMEREPMKILSPGVSPPPSTPFSATSAPFKKKGTERLWE